MSEIQMHAVYLLRSQKNPNRVYVGLCDNMKSRLAEYNSGECKTTAEARPWGVDVAVYFQDDKKAHAFERYLKTGSGRAFSKRHLRVLIADCFYWRRQFHKIVC